MADIMIRNTPGKRAVILRTGKSQGTTPKELNGLSSSERTGRSTNGAEATVSEKMRTMMNELAQVEKGLRSNVGLLQMGEGSLEEIHNRLNRAAELADLAANSAYDDTIDRSALQDELTQLCKEIDRIIKNTVFDTTKLFQNKGYEYETSGSYQYDPLTEKIMQAIIQKEDQSNANEFPDWLKEGLSQLSSTPGKWIEYMGISPGSSNAAIMAAIRANALGSGTAASKFGTGYLACMYLGAIIAGGGELPPQVDVAFSSEGLLRLLDEVASGKSLDDAIKLLTNGKFQSCADFETQFNACPTEIASFIHDLLSATGENLENAITENLTASFLQGIDLDIFTQLLQLGMSSNAIKNASLDSSYTNNTSNYTGTEGMSDTSGTTQASLGTTASALPSKVYGDLVVSGADISKVKYDTSTGILTVKSAEDITISMKTAEQTSAMSKIVLDGTGKVILNNVKLAQSDAFTIKNGTAVIYEGKNNLSSIKLENGVSVLFEGTGQMKTAAFISDATNEVSFQSGAMIIGDKGQGVIRAGKVIIDRASVAASIPSQVINPKGEVLQPIALSWPRLSGLINNIISAKIDGVNTKMLIDKNQPAVLWFIPSFTHRIKFTDSNGAETNLAAELEAAAAKLGWLNSIKPFTVTGGTEGNDWEYGTDGRTLIIKSNTPLAISGGIGNDEAGKAVVGRMKLADHIAGNINLTLDGVDCQLAFGCALDLGRENKVTLTLTDGKVSAFASGGCYAGISVGKGTELTIEGNGELLAVGGMRSAGIGRSNVVAAGDAADMTSNIIIRSGSITAKGGKYGAGIGAGSNFSFGDIIIDGGQVNAEGGFTGAGIGGSYGASVGDIRITDGTVYANSAGHGAGIGSGWGQVKTGDIIITGGQVTAVSKLHGIGIGAGRNAASGNIIIGDKTRPNQKIIVTALGGMTHNGGNIAFGSGEENGSLTIIGNNTTVRPGNTGEGLYSTSGAVDGNGNPVYAYPVYLFRSTPSLTAGKGLDALGLPLPADIISNSVTITALGRRSGMTKTWTQGLLHEPEEKYTFIWMTGEDQRLTVTYADSNGSDHKVELNLTFFPDAGVFRVQNSQPAPLRALKPEYASVGPASPNPGPDPEPPVVPHFYLSAEALKIANWNISTRNNAQKTIPVIEKAVRRVSSIRSACGALMNRLEYYYQQNFGQPDKKSPASGDHIRDAAIARGSMDHVALTIKNQTAQAMLAQSNQNMSQILQLL